MRLAPRLLFGRPRRMIFSEVPLAAAEGAILAHTLRWDSGALRKGTRLHRPEIDRLRAVGVTALMAAREEPGDLHEDAAAALVANAMLPQPGRVGFRIGPARHGRVNCFAARTGLLRVNGDSVTACNALSEAIAVSTLPDLAWVSEGQLSATVKIIPFAVPAMAARDAAACLADASALEVRPAQMRSATLIATRSRWTPPSLQAKGCAAVRSRLAALGVQLDRVREVEHAVEPVAQALARDGSDLVLLLGDTVTSDRGDVLPSAVRRAGGVLRRFGIPVDPGNLLLLGELRGRPVIVLPGCARSPRLNGADWVMRRVACGLPISDAEFASMGVGGLLHEIASRPSPRLGGREAPARPRIPALLLAAGQSCRMPGRHKLLREAAGIPLVVRVARRLSDSAVSEVVAVVGDETDPVGETLRRADVPRLRLCPSPLRTEGMGASIRAGIAAVANEADAVLISLADMPGIESKDVDRLVRAYDPVAGRGICRLVGPEQEPGHPVLFGRRYFEALGALVGDRGARDIVLEHPEDLADLRVPAERLTDLDTEADWERWLQG